MLNYDLYSWCKPWRSYWTILWGLHPTKSMRLIPISHWMTTLWYPWLCFFFFCNHNFAVKINFFSPNHTKGKSSCWLIKLVYCKYLPHHWSHINWLYFYWKTLTGSYMAMCKFDKNKITYTMDKNFNGDVVSATNIMLPIKLYRCLMISNMSVASSDDN